MSGPRIIGVDHVPIGLLEALWSFGVTIALAAALIWSVLHYYAGDGMLRRRTHVICALSVAPLWAVIQHWRGSDDAGSAILGIEAGIVTLCVGIAYARCVRCLRARR